MTLKKTILLVDDDPAIRDMYSQKLKAVGYNVLESDDGIAGLTEAVTSRPDLIILDVRMTHLNGFETIKRLRTQGEWGKGVPVIFLTNISPNEEAELTTITSTTPAYYLIKSNTTPDDLVAKIGEVLNS